MNAVTNGEWQVGRAGVDNHLPTAYLPICLVVCPSLITRHCTYEADRRLGEPR